MAAFAEGLGGKLQGSRKGGHDRELQQELWRKKEGHHGRQE